jgi:hypothetical protein
LGQGKALILIDGAPYCETKYRRLNLGQIPAGIIAEIIGRTTPTARAPGGTCLRS